VDPDFNNSIDGLMELDICRMRPEKHARYFRTVETAAGKPAA